MSDTYSDTGEIIAAAMAAARPTTFGDNELATYIVPEGAKVETVDVAYYLDRYREHPRRKVGNFKVQDAQSFIAYLAKHGVTDSEVWADSVGAQIVGVINAHEGVDGPVGPDGPLAGWGDHRVTYAVQTTTAWDAWAERDGQLMDQSTFAELIEDRAIDIIDPSAADMLELAQTFQATIGVKFESSKLLSSGERQLEYREQVEAKAGRAGQLVIPKAFKLALRPFEGAEVYGISARFRYRMADGALRVGYRLERPDDVLREAFEGVVKQVEDAVEQPVFRGVST